jgi:mono/diheme cytochrome c family protein
VETAVLHEGTYEPDTTQSAEWNRGKYRVDGLAHWGACHKPRNLLGGDERGRKLGGGVAQGWNAPPLDASNPLNVSWDETLLHIYLKTGLANGHSSVIAPMGPMTEGPWRVNDADVKVIATYIASHINPDAEASQGPASATVANAVADATGVRFFDIPLYPEKVRATIVAL